MKKTLQSIRIALLFLLLLNVGRSFGQISGTSLFLQGAYLEAGLNSTATFGSGAAAPSTYHPHNTTAATICGASSTDILGLVYDYGFDGWTTGTPPSMGDFTTTGIPWESWVVEVGGASAYAVASSCSVTGGLSASGSYTSYTNTGGSARGVWTGTVGTLLTMRKEYRIDTNSSAIIMTVTFINLSSSDITGVYYMRTVDPDNSASYGSGGSFSTNNYVDYQNDAEHRVMVRAVSIGSLSGTPVTSMSLATKDCRAKALYYATWPLSTSCAPSSVWAGTASCLGASSYTAGASSLNADLALGLVYKIDTIHGRDSAVISFAYVFDGTPGIDRAFPAPQMVVNSVAYDSVDTVSPCSGITASTIPVSISNAVDKSWTWSRWSWAPATGLSATTGTSVTVNRTGFSAPVTYTITGTNRAMGDCASKTFLLTIYPAFAPITGGSDVCVGNTITLSDSTAGGTWSSVFPAIATINSSGVVTGVSAGVDTIKYSKTFSCGTVSVTKVITVRGLPVVGAISGPDSVCVGSVVTYTDTPSGGVWSSGSPAIFSVTATGGVVRGNSVGQDSLYYTVTNGCGSTAKTKLVKVISAPDAGTISGSNTICMGTPVTLTESATGGTWSSSNTGVATISTTGTVTGVLSGTAIISYTVSSAACGSISDTMLVTVTHAPGAGTITGGNTVCAGSTLLLSDATTGGTWSSASPTIATVNTTGTVTGVAGGTALISYTVSNICGSASDTQLVTVSPLPVVSAISGPTSVCVGSSTVLTNATTGGVWSTSSSTVASVSTTGTVYGLTVGAATISYTVTNSCGSTSATLNISVNASGSVGPISGPTTVCVAANITLTDSTAGGTWSSTFPSIATISNTGVVTGVAAGTDTIKYTATGCGSAVAMYVITVLPFPTAGTITGAGSVCPGANITLSSTATGGTWSSANTGVATVNSSTGSVTGVAAGTTLISYTTSNSCGLAITSASVTVLPNSVSPIAGLSTVCQGSSITLTDADAGGSWSSVFPAIATVSATGVVTGVSAGTDTIKYTIANTCGTFSASKVVTVTPIPAVGPITGSSTVCVGGTTTLADTSTGGVWTSGAPTIATVNASGVVTGVATGSATITYTLTNACGTAFTTKTINSSLAPTVGPVTGPTLVCQGSTITMADTTAGGTWGSSNAAVATVNSAGVVTGIGGGTAVISYTIANSCGSTFSTRAITVIALPLAGTITGANNVCIGSTATLTNTVTGGTWASSNSTVATVNTTGVVTAVATGTTIISYTVTNSCGTATDTQAVTVVPIPVAGTITGTQTVCQGATTTLSNATTGGVWSSTNTAIATVNTTGVVTGIAGGTSIISYTVTNFCGTATDTALVTVNPLPAPAAITGTTTICQGAATTLSDATTGGTWSSGSPGIATVSTGGIVTGVTPGTATITYSVTNSCGTTPVTTTVTVNAMPVAGTITGSSLICVSSAATLTNGTGGGTWSSANTAVATVSATGSVTGTGPGTTTISYTVTNSCGSATATHTMNVNAGPNPGVINGTTTVCTGNTTTLTDTVTGGTWLSASPSVATVNPVGVVTGVSAGTAVISYAVAGSCGVVAATATVTVNPAPDAGTISGPAVVCAGANITLTTTGTGGVWSSSNAALASVAGATGVVTGLSAGAVTITYFVSNSCGTATATYNITVNPATNAGAITGPASVCVGSSVTLADTVSGGTWSSSNTAMATISTTGTVTGITAGALTITYSVTTSCGTVNATRAFTVNPLPNSGTITGPGSVCVGSAVTVTTTGTGGTWSASNGNATVNAAGSVGGVSGGQDTIYYSVTNTCGTSVSSYVITIGAPTSAGTISGPTSVCTGTAVSLSSTATGGTWVSSNSTVATVNPSTGSVYGRAVGTVTITYILSSSCGTALSTAPMTVNLSPSAGTITGANTVCAGSNITLTNAATGGTWSSSNTAVASVNTTGVVNGLTAGSAIISYSVTNICGTATDTQAVTVNALPDAGTISGAGSLCPASTLTLSNTATGGTWSSSSPSVATVSATGVVTGVAVGSATITYTSVTACGTARSTASVTVNLTPSAGTVAGPSAVCIGSVVVLTDAVTGGTWSSSNPSVASVSTAGAVTGVAVGIVSISYSVTNSCGTAIATQTVNVSNAPDAGTITAPSTMCAGTGATLSSSVSGGTWTTSSAALASINGSTGVLTAISAGTVTITYTATTGCGSTFTTTSITINPAAIAGTISGPTTVCTGSNISLSTTGTGGTWSSNNPTVATVSSTGLVSGLSNGSATISYTVTNSCGTSVATASVTVSNTPSAGTISGSTTLCVGSPVALSSTVAGGTWASSTPAVVTITPSGIATGMSSGAATITYSVTTSCGSATTTVPVTVTTSPSAGTISGASVVCIGSNITLTDATSGGTWSSSNASVATVDATGLVTGTGVGTATISYSVTNTCGTAVATQPVTVDNAANAGTIGGTTTVCAGSTTTLTETATGGTWSTSNAAVASVNSTGTVFGVSAGTANITYTSTTACATAATSTAVTVNPLPSAGSISGASAVCIGSTITLTDATTGGTWSSANAAIASVDATGVVTGTGVGTTTISYSVTNSCGTANATHSVTSDNAANAGTIGGTTTLCAGTTTTLTETATGGTWSTTNASVASVSAAGVVTGVSAGTATVSYTVTTGCSSAATSTTITVNPNADAGTISGPSTVCVSATATLTDAATGGTWTTSNASVATVSTTGVVTGVSNGSATITYTVTNSCGTATATHAITVNPLAVAGSLSGTATVCVAATTVLSPSVGGGSWSSSNAAIATVNGVGIVTGVSAGNATISYSVTNSCGTVSATMNVTVMPFPSAGVITGPGTACLGATVTYVDTTAGGVWSSGNTSVASVNTTGGVTGVGIGTTNIYYTITNMCGSTNVTISVNVIASPSTSIISGTTTVCPGTSTTLTDTVAGGVWSSNDTTIATVSPATGAVVTVTGVASGTAIISYTTINACGTAVATAYVTVNSMGDPGTISGVSTVCPGGTTALSESVSGGSWAIADTTVATISATGVVTGRTTGTTIVTYTVTGTCGLASVFDTITVAAPPTPAAISGTSTICLATATTLTAATTGGAWASSDTTIATVDAAGVVYGVRVGTATISYTLTNACGNAVSTASISVNSIPYEGLIVGATTVCLGSSTTLTETVSGGVWSSSDSTIATVSTTGLVTGITAGNVVISYTITTACGTGIATAYMTVRLAPGAGTVTGASSVCLGSATAFADTVLGGTWSSSDTTIATVSTAGIVTGIATGTATISYTVSGTCGSSVATASISVLTAPATAGTITGGGSAVCPGTTFTLADSVTGGSWSSSSTSVATVDATGVVTGVAGGTAVITYTVSNACGATFTTTGVTIIPATDAGMISGTTTTVCIGSAITLTDSVAGGSWSISDTTIAVVSTTGIVTGRAAGTAILTYTTTGSCGTAYTSTMITVDPLPVVSAIIGTSGLCSGMVTATLTDTTAGGTWSSSNTAVATIDASGVVNATGIGVTYISYTVTNIYGCSASAVHMLGVGATPSVSGISGPGTVCAGGTITLVDTTTGGIWTTSDTSIAVVSATGVVTGVSGGTVTVSYTVGTGCTATATAAVTVGAAPVVSSITGTAPTCPSGMATMASATTGGTWSSSNAAIATVDAAGNVTAVSAGTVTITYAVTGTGGCTGFATTTFTVNALPTVSAITGVPAICTGSSATFTDSVAGGTWASSNSSVASVDASGNVFGASVGSATISYIVSNTCGATYATYSVTIGAGTTVSAISGLTNLCAGGSTTLTNATTGGTWSSSNTAVATISTTGVVTALSAGTTTISYSVSGSCGLSMATLSFTVNALPTAGAISGSSALCPGSSAPLTATVSGGTWSSSNPSVISVSTTGVVTAVSTGTATISYTVTNASGCSSVATFSVTSGGVIVATLTPTAGATLCGGSPVTLSVATSATGLSYTWYRNGTLISGATGASYVASIAGNYAVIASNGCITDTLNIVSVLNPPAPVITHPGGTTLSTGSYAAYQWYLNGVAIAGATNATYSYSSPGNYTVRVTDGHGCSATSAIYNVAPVSEIGTVVDAADIKMYPNPATEAIFIDAPCKVNVAVLAADGKVVYRLNDATRIDVSILPDAMYMIMIYDTENRLLKAEKFIKAN